MSLNKVIIVHSSSLDPVLDALNGDVFSYHVDNFRFQICKEGYEYRIKSDCSIFSERASGYAVINRHFAIETTEFFEECHSKSIGINLAQNLIQDTYNQSNIIATSSCIRGASHSLLSLPSQWYLINNKFGDYIRTPEYYYCFGREEPPPHVAGPDWFEKSVWSLYNWRETEITRQSERYNRFFVKKERAEPLLCSFYVVNNELIKIRVNYGMCDEETRQKLKFISLHLSNLFESLIGEFLVWVCKDTVTFGFFSPTLSYASKHLEFRNDIRLWAGNISRPR